LSRVVAVFGGSFDPVHAAHLEVARRALAQVPCDEVWFLPAARAVHKPEGAHAHATHRRAMLELALDGSGSLEICSLELDHGTPRRSLDSLTELASRWPEHRWFFLIGEDSFRDLDTWYRPEELFSIAPPVVAPRPGSGGDRPGEWRGVPVRWLEGEEIDLDSTALREALARDEKPGGLDPRVLGYIREHGLYREQQR
jgi:nicotinate-nucleotide adenylyltransferase